MRFSYKIATLAGIPVKVHVTFLLIVILIGAGAVSPIQFAARAAMVGLLFSSVVLHELGHALAARRYGIPTREITLLPIGGVAMLERFPTNPRHEIVIALAGPAVSFALAAAAWPLARLAAATPLAFGLSEMATVNAILGLFNLVPALPMDGGRVLRGLLALRLGRGRATRIAARVGRVLAVGFVVLGVFYNPWLAAVGAFVFLAAGSEARQDRIQGALADHVAREAMLTDFRVLTPETVVGSAAQTAFLAVQDDFPVVRLGYVVGAVTRAALRIALAEGRAAESVSAIMRPIRRFANPDTPLADLAADLLRAEGGAVPVVDGGRLIGLLTVRSLFRFAGPSRQGA